MLKSNLRRDQVDGATRWTEAMREVGVPDETIEMVVETALADHDARQVDFFDQVEERMYVEEFPEGLITIDDAANKFDLNRGTVYAWVQKGYIRERGRLRAPGKGSGKIVLEEAEFQEFLKIPRKTGRPRKVPTDQVEERMYVAELPEGLITIDDAANKFGLNRETVRTWLQRGYVRERGRLRASARGGGKIVLDVSEFQEFLKIPRKTGRPRKVPTDQVEERMYVGEVPEGLITIDDAANKFGLNRKTIYSWLWKGLLRERGRLRAPGKGGGKILLDEAEFQKFLDIPRKKGRPRKNRHSY